MHKGGLLISLADFGALTIENGPRKERHRPRLRDHGHRRSILRSYHMSGRCIGTPGTGGASVPAPGHPVVAISQCTPRWRRAEVNPRTPAGAPPRSGAMLAITCRTLTYPAPDAMIRPEPRNRSTSRTSWGE